MSAPLLDRRAFDELVESVRAAAAAERLPWQPGQADAGDALVAVFAHYCELVLERLNRVPEKSLVAFLDLLGVGPLPAGAASAPVVFALAAGAGESGLVPAGTQVATRQTQTSPAVVYETQSQLVVTAAQIAAVDTVEPDADRWADQTRAAAGADGILFRPFAGDRPLDHAVYLGTPAERPLLRGVPGSVAVLLKGGDPEFFAGLEWAVFRDGTWHTLGAPRLERPFQTRLRSGRIAGDSREVSSRVTERFPIESSWAFGLGEVRGRTAVRTSADGLSVLVFEEVRGPDLFALPETGTEARWFRARLPHRLSAGAVHAQRELAAIGLVARTSEQAYAGAGESGVLWIGGRTGLGPDRHRVHLGLVVDHPVLPKEWQFLDVVWRYWNGSKFAPLGTVSVERFQEQYAEEGLTDTTRGLQKSGWISFDRPADLAYGRPEGVPAQLDAYWLTAQVSVGDVKRGGVAFQRAGVRSSWLAPDLAPDAAALASAPIDVTSSFRPFGAQPQLGDAFYLGSGEAFAQAGAVATVFVSLAQAGIPAPLLDQEGNGDPRFELAWEYHGSTGWTPLGSTRIDFDVTLRSPTKRASARMTNAGAFTPIRQTAGFTRLGVALEGVHDSTEAFSRDGEVVFRVPADVQPTTVAGATSCWLRARIVRGAYGRPPAFIPFVDPPTTPQPTFVLAPGTGNLAPPVVRSVGLAYNYTSPLPLELVTRNGFDVEDLTAANTAGELPGAVLAPVAEQEPTLYVGFDRALGNDSVSLYFAAPARQFVADLDPDAGGADAGTRLAWEYWNGREWAALAVVDSTRDLTEPGTVGFVGPDDLEPLARVDSTPRPWIRVRLLARGTEYDPTLSGIYLNAVEAVQATTAADEVLGSSTGGPGQSFRVARTSVFPGQRLAVVEPERPPATEERALTAEEGVDAIAADPAGGFRVRWHEVGTLARSGPRDRHYTLDRVAGVVSFGDGVNGLAPPAGRDNVRCTYTAGGSAAGNQPAGAISQLKSSIPFVASVTNPLPADGGSGAETLAGAVARGPQRLRNRGRAVSADDFRWLAREAAGTEVARAEVLPNRDADLDYRPGWVSVVIVPDGTAARLLPTPQLVKRVEESLLAATSATLALQSPARVNVVAPGYVPVQLHVELRPVDFGGAEAVRAAALAAIDAFLHPLTGGPDGGGWPFGRAVYLSEVYALLEALPGVDHVHALRFQPNVALLPLLAATPWTPREAVPVGARLTRRTDALLRGRVVEPLPAGVATRTLSVTLVREGEAVALGDPQAPVARPTVRSVSGSTLAVDPFVPQVDVPAGTRVTALAGGGVTTLTAAAAAGALVSQLAVADFSTPPAGDPWLRAVRFPLLRDKAGELVLGERLAVPAFSLPYSAGHVVEISQD